MKNLYMPDSSAVNLTFSKFNDLFSSILVYLPLLFPVDTEVRFYLMFSFFSAP